MLLCRGALLLGVLLALPAAAQEHVLRFATIIPDGTPWAREVRAFARDVEKKTAGSVRVKIYFGGIAGDETESLQRIQRDQLDATVASMLCHRLAPSMRVTRVPGLLQGRE